MDVLVLIDKLDDVVHNARPVPLTDQVRVDREEIYDLLDQMRATIPEEIKQARWIVKERQEMLAEAKREAERIVREAREQQARLISDEEVTKQAERAADEIVEDARTREREIRLGAEDYADEILNTLEVNLQKFLAAVQRGRDRLAGRDEEPAAELEQQQRGRACPSNALRAECSSGPRPSLQRRASSLSSAAQRGSVPPVVLVVGGVGVVEGLAADRAEAGAVGAAEDPGGEGEDRRRRGPSGRCRARRRRRRGCAAPRPRCRPGRPRGPRPRGRARPARGSACRGPRGGAGSAAGRRSRRWGGRPRAARSATPGSAT